MLWSPFHTTSNWSLDEQTDTSLFLPSQTPDYQVFIKCFTPPPHQSKTSTYESWTEIIDPQTQVSSSLRDDCETNVGCRTKCMCGMNTSSSLNLCFFAYQPHLLLHQHLIKPTAVLLSVVGVALVDGYANNMTMNLLEQTFWGNI